MPATNETERPGAVRQPESDQSDDARRRSAGEAFDRRMEDLVRDAPRAPRPDQERRGKRR